MWDFNYTTSDGWSGPGQAGKTYVWENSTTVLEEEFYSCQGSNKNIWMVVTKVQDNGGIPFDNVTDVSLKFQPFAGGPFTNQTTNAKTLTVLGLGFVSLLSALFF